MEWHTISAVCTLYTDELKQYDQSQVKGTSLSISKQGHTG